MTIQEKAQRAIERGSKMTFEQIVEMLEKTESKKQSSSYKRKQAKKMAQRDAVRNMPRMTERQIQEINEESKINQAKAAGLI